MNTAFTQVDWNGDHFAGNRLDPPPLQACLDYGSPIPDNT